MDIDKGTMMEDIYASIAMSLFGITAGLPSLTKEIVNIKTIDENGKEKNCVRLHQFKNIGAVTKDGKTPIDTVTANVNKIKVNTTTPAYGVNTLDSLMLAQHIGHNKTHFTA